MRWVSLRNNKAVRAKYFENWSKWFAWYPVRAVDKHGDYSWVWLEAVHRKLKSESYISIMMYISWIPDMDYKDHRWTYKQIEEVIDNER